MTLLPLVLLKQHLDEHGVCYINKRACGYIPTKRIIQISNARVLATETLLLNIGQSGKCLRLVACYNVILTDCQPCFCRQITKLTGSTNVSGYPELVLYLNLCVLSELSDLWPYDQSDMVIVKLE